MGEVITMATERGGYTLSDRGTYLAYMTKTDLKIAVEGDPGLFNPYGVIMVNPAKHPHVKVGLTQKFMDFLVSEQGRQLITSYKVNGNQLFYVAQ
jgi:tungstate transport system substrate-binding protein